MAGKNRVLLVTPRPVLGLIAVGSALKQQRNVDVDILVLSTSDKGELAAGETNVNLIIPLLKSFLGDDLLWVGLTVFSSYTGVAQTISQLVKFYNKELPVVWGGIHPTLYPEQPLESECVDISVYGDGEMTACELVDVFRDGKKISDVSGIVFKDNDRPVKNPPREYTDLANVGNQDYSLVRNQNILFERKYCFDNIVSVHVANGCPFKCSFCINTSLNRKHNRKSPEQVIDQIEYLIKTYQIDEIDFIDELFLVNKKWIEEFSSLLIKKNIKIRWRANGHAHTLSDNGKYPDDFLRELKRLGLTMTTMGAESGSELQLQIMNKKTSPDQILTGVRRMKDIGLFCGMTYLVGTPHEDEEDLLKTISHIKEVHRISSEYPYLAFQVYRPYPGNKMFDAAVQAGYKNPETLNDWIECLDFGSGGVKNWHAYPWMTYYKRRLIQHVLTLAMHYNKTLNRKWHVPWAPGVYPYDSRLNRTMGWQGRISFPVPFFPIRKKCEALLKKRVDKNRRF